MGDTNVKRPPKVSKDLQNAIYDDFVKKAQNDAKFRAVAQYADYESFKNMVATAHLRPINDGKKSEEPGTPRGFMLAPDGTRMSPPSGASGAPVGQSHGPSALSELQQPSTSPEFQRDWRRHCTTATDRVKYLQLCGAENLPSIFKVEINAPLLSEILVALEEVVGASEGPEPTLPFALDCLGGLAQGGRFSLNVRLLAKSGKEAARALLGRAAAQGGDVSARAQALASQYSIHM